MANFDTVKADADAIATVPLTNPDSPVLWEDGGTYNIRLTSGIDVVVGSFLGGSSGNLAADYSGLTPVTWSARQNDLAIPPSVTGWKATLVGNQEITGIAGGVAGAIYLIYNVAGGDLKFKRQNVNSASGNRFITPHLVDYDLRDHGSVYVRYDATLDGGAGGWHLLDNKP